MWFKTLMKGTDLSFPRCEEYVSSYLTSLTFIAQNYLDEVKRTLPFEMKIQ
jgi:hypothetical protein